MSKNETPMTRWLWGQIGGTLVEEFCMVPSSPTCGARRLDGLIIKGEAHRIARHHEVDVADKDIVLIQAKNSRLGMYIMGQAFFSAELMKRFNPRSIESICLVTANDSVLGPIFESYPGMRVVVCQPL